MFHRICSHLHDNQTHKLHLFMNSCKLTPSLKKAKHNPPKRTVPPDTIVRNAPALFRAGYTVTRKKGGRLEGTVTLNLRGGGRFLRASTGVPCSDVTLFDRRTGEGGISESDKLQLAQWLARANQIAADLRLSGRPIDVYAIRDALFSGEHSLFTTLKIDRAIDLYIDNQEIRMSAGQIVQRTYWKNRRWANDFRNWCNTALGKHALITELKPIHVRAFSLWLQTSRKDPNRSTTERLSNNSAEATASHANVMMKFWYDNEWIPKNPFVNFRRKMHTVEFKSLTMEEVQRLYDLPLESASLATIRDVFIFMALSALNYADIERLKVADVKLHDGKPYLEVVRRKMQNRPDSLSALIPLDATAMLLLGRYWPGEENPEALIFPVQANAAFNRSLKQLGHLASVKKSLTTNLARKSLANYALDTGLPPATISSVLGHADLGTLMRHYAKHQPGRVLRDFDKLIGTLPGNTLYGLSNKLHPETGSSHAEHHAIHTSPSISQ